MKEVHYTFNGSETSNNIFSNENLFQSQSNKVAYLRADIFVGMQQFLAAEEAFYDLQFFG